MTSSGTSLFEVLQDTGYSELNFPTQPELQSPKNEYGPNTTPYSSTNGLTYVYDEKKASWTLLRGDTATQDWVNQQLLFKLDKAGGLLIGDLRIQDNSDSATIPNLTVYNSGTIEFAPGGDKTIAFKGGGIAEAGKITGGPNDLIVFYEGKVSFRKTLTLDHTETLIQHTNTSSDTLTLMDLGTSASGTTNKVLIGSRGKFVIGTGGDDIFTIEGSGTVISNLTFIGPDNILEISSTDLKVSDDYNQNLLSGGGADTSLATVAYVKEGAFRPGMAVFAQTEGEAEENGLWKSDFRYYIKVEQV